MELAEGIEVAKEMGLTIYDHAFGSGSYANLEGVLPSHVTVAELAIKLCEYDGTVISNGGLRSEAAARQNVANKTGILNSLHRRQPDGYGHAIDLIPLLPGQGIVWPKKNSDPAWHAFKAMAKAVKIASAILSVPIRQGCDWNMNGTFGESGEYDWPHFEYPRVSRNRRAIAQAEMERYRRELKLDTIDDPDEPDEEEPENDNNCECPECGHKFKVVSA